MELFGRLLVPLQQLVQQVLQDQQGLLEQLVQLVLLESVLQVQLALQEQAEPMPYMIQIKQ
jgi:hypothetical protein